MRGDVRVVSGVPTVAMFSNTSGSPIIIDSDTDTAYYLKNNVVTSLAGGTPAGVTQIVATGDGSGNTSLSSTGPAYTPLVGILLIIGSAVVGDVWELEVSFAVQGSGLAGTAYISLAFTAGGNTVPNTTTLGMPGTPSNVQVSTISYRAIYTVAAPDISGGSVVIRPAYFLGAGVSGTQSYNTGGTLPVLTARKIS